MPVQASSKHSHTQPLKGGVVPYLMLEGAGAAIDFYKQALGAEEIGERVNMEEGRIMQGCGILRRNLPRQQCRRSHARAVRLSGWEGRHRTHGRVHRARVAVRRLEWRTQFQAQ